MTNDQSPRAGDGNDKLKQSAEKLLSILDEHMYTNDYCGLEVGKRHAGTLLDAADAVRAALAAAPSAAPAWQPIETAPKDGWFLAFKPGVAHIVGTILDSDHPDCEFDGGVHEAWSHRYVDGITHWMPLPAAPEIPCAATAEGSKA